MAPHDGPDPTAGHGDGTAAGDVAPVTEEGARRLMRAGVVTAVGLVTVIGLLVVAPWLGALVSVATMVAVVPLGSPLASARLVASMVLGCGLLALGLVIGDEVGFRVLSPGRVQIAFALPVLVAAVVVMVCVVLGRRVPWARADLGLVPPLLVTGAAWAATGLPAWGVELGQGVGGLMLMGWDHQSHFSIFSYVYDQGGVWRTGDPASASMFLGYPPLAGAIGAAVAMLFAPAQLSPVEQFPLYLQATAATFGVGAGLLAWTAGSLGRRVAAVTRHRDRAGSIGLVSGLVVGGYVVLGPAAALFDYGFTNFFFGIALATAVSWLAIAGARSASALSITFSGTVTVAAAAALAHLWTPLVVLMVPAGLVLLACALRARRWWSLVAMGCLAAVGGWVAVWQTFRIAPTGGGAGSLVQTLAVVGGGQPAVPLPHLLALAVVGVAGPALLGSRWRAFAWAPLAAPAAGILVAAVFVLNTFRAGFPITDAYYVAKSLWIVYVALIPVAGATAAIGALALLQRSAPHHPAWRDRTQVGLAGVVAASLLWAASPTQNAPGGVIDYYATPVGGQAVPDRWNAFRNVPQGNVVAHAQECAARWPNRLAIVWDSGDLLTNRWLASLRGDLDSQSNAVYTALAAAPYAEPARDAVGAAMVADPTLEVVLVVATPESQELLRPLKREFPGRVTVLLG